ncbi:ParA family protein [Xanthobacter sp. AM11]|uniref:ParA family protein n=1 Tax=Xanthobacter sp. AM11 TaxID=3380643 RepID=UPI0039BF698D
MADASGRVIAVANMKGGVGKTTTVVMLAEGFAEDGERVLVVDLDAQTNASYCFAMDEELEAIFSRRHTFSAFLADRLIYGDKNNVVDYITSGVSHVTKAGERLRIDLLAAHPRLRLLEREIMIRFSEQKYGIRALEGQSLKVLSEALEILKTRYDIIILDCAPGISAFTEVAIRLADLVIVPTIPDYLSTIGLDAFCVSLWENKQMTRSSLPKPKRNPVVLPTRVNAGKVQHRRMLKTLRDEAAAHNALYDIFDMEIENRAAVERATDPENASPVPSFELKWTREAVGLVRGLVSETRRRLYG